MELGGKNPQIVFDDADLDAAPTPRSSAPSSMRANAAMPAAG